MERLLDVPHAENVHLISFADDVTIIISGRNCLNQAKNILELIEARVSELGLNINIKKTKALKISSGAQLENIKIQNKTLNGKTGTKC